MRQVIYVLDCHSLYVHIPTSRIQQNTKHTLLKYNANALVILLQLLQASKIMKGKQASPQCLSLFNKLGKKKF